MALKKTRPEYHDDFPGMRGGGWRRLGERGGMVCGLEVGRVSLYDGRNIKSYYRFQRNIYNKINHLLSSLQIPVNMDFLATIAPPVVSQPQAFSDAMLDPASRGLMTTLSTEHMSGATLHRTLQQSGDQLQRTVQGQFVSLKVGSLH